MVQVNKVSKYIHYTTMADQTNSPMVTKNTQDMYQYNPEDPDQPEYYGQSSEGDQYPTDHDGWSDSDLPDKDDWSNDPETKNEVDSEDWSHLSGTKDQPYSDQWSDLPELQNQSDSDSDSEDSRPPRPKLVCKYKKVALKVRPQAIMMPEALKPQRYIPSNPLLKLPKLPYHPPRFYPTYKVSQERMDSLGIEDHEELLPEEKKLLQHVIVLNEHSIAFDEAERGTFKNTYFSDYVIPTVNHEPWIEKNIPLPQGHKDEIIQLLKEKIKAGVYESAQTPYRSKWFCVKKKDGGLRIVHDLQRLNSVTIRDSAVPPLIEEFVEAYAGRSVYTVLDMYWGFHARMLDVNSRDLTAFQTPLGSFRLTSLPMGYVNAPAEFQASMVHILQDEVPDIAGVFIDDIPIKGPPTRYPTAEGKEETLPQNPGIRRYIWEHLNDVHRILHRIGEAGGTVSAKKMQLCRAEVEIVGHQCSGKGRTPVDNRIKKILTWPTPINLKEVRGFLGLCGTVRIWIKDYSLLTKPLVDLTRKGVDFHWDPEQETAFQKLKELVTQAPALRPIDYTSNRRIYLLVDTSIYGIGFILSQEDENGQRVPARYGSLPLKPHEANYGQSKLELLGLLRALREFRTQLAGAKNLKVEVDASSIKGMLEHPDIQPSALINRWIQGVLLYISSEDLIHIPGNKHLGPDALSRRRFTSEDEEEELPTDPEEWVDDIALMALEDENPPSATDEESTNQRTPMSRTILPPLSRKPAAKHKCSEEDLVNILTYLVTKRVPEDLTTREQARFISKSQPFYLKEVHMYRRRPGGPDQVVIFPPKRRREILWEMHEGLGHHGTWAVEKQTMLRCYWPGMKKQIKEHIRSCHSCQLRSTKKMHLPVTVSHPPCLFSKVYLDVMKMPLARGKQWLIGCRDDLSGVTECKAIARDTAKAIAKFFLERIILRYGFVQEVVTDNGPSFSKEFAELMKQYGLHHIKISPYNSQANGVVERGHYNIREALVKLCDGDLSRWPSMVDAACHADRITVRRSTGYSPYFLLHGVHPLLPGDLADATFMVSKYRPGMPTAKLIEARTQQLLRLPKDLAKARSVLKQSRFRSKEQFERKYARRIQEEGFQPGTSVLIRNNPIENSVSIERKTANRYMGPYLIERQTQGGSYILTEMDGSLLRHHVAAFRLVPYIQQKDLDAVAEESEAEPITEWSDAQSNEE